jgi:hypothetical protein
LCNDENWICKGSSDQTDFRPQPPEAGQLKEPVK